LERWQWLNYFYNGLLCGAKHAKIDLLNGLEGMASYEQTNWISIPTFVSFFTITVVAAQSPM
jgi:TM2 domain-containing membrane protein YozV